MVSLSVFDYMKNIVRQKNSHLRLRGMRDNTEAVSIYLALKFLQQNSLVICVWLNRKNINLILNGEWLNVCIFILLKIKSVVIRNFSII